MEWRFLRTVFECSGRAFYPQRQSFWLLFVKKLYISWEITLRHSTFISVGWLGEKEILALLYSIPHPLTHPHTRSHWYTDRISGKYFFAVLQRDIFSSLFSASRWCRLFLSSWCKCSQPPPQPTAEACGKSVEICTSSPTVGWHKGVWGVERWKREGMLYVCTSCVVCSGGVGRTRNRRFNRVASSPIPTPTLGRVWWCLCVFRFREKKSAIASPHRILEAKQRTSRTGCRETAHKECRCSRGRVPRSFARW